MSVHKLSANLSSTDLGSTDTQDPSQQLLLQTFDSVSPLLQHLQQQPLLHMTAVLALLALVALTGYALVRLGLLRLVRLLVRQLPELWLSELLSQGVFQRLVPMVPMLILHRGLILVPHLAEPMLVFLQRLLLALLILFGARSLSALLNAAHSIYQRYPIARGRPIKGYIQVSKLLLYLLTGILIIASLAGQSPWFFISGLGAMTAVIMLIFRDTILSFVAGIQLVNNDLVRVGDWIEMPQFNADGDVIDISLNAVRVQNWDSTVTVIPTHNFLDNAFKNWRNMFDTGGRRIKRSIYLDMGTIRFLTAAEIERFERFLLLQDYMQVKRQEIAEWNTANCPTDVADIPANTRHLTNIGTFRAYISAYLRRHPQIHQDRVFLIRQLQPGPQGLPIEIYVFTSDTRWVQYEGIQSDIFDHILAVAPEFGLRIFQQPSGQDIADAARSFASRLPAKDAVDKAGGLSPQLPGGSYHTSDSPG